MNTLNTSLPSTSGSGYPIVHLNTTISSIDQLTPIPAMLGDAQESTVCIVNVLSNGVQFNLYKATIQVSKLDADGNQCGFRSHTIYRVEFVGIHKLSIALLHALGDRGITSNRYVPESRVVDYINLIVSTKVPETKEY